MRRRMILFAFGTFIIAATIGITLFINTTRVDRTKAREGMNENYILIQDPDLTNEFSLPATVVTHKAENAEGTVYLRKIKPTTQQSVTSAK